MKKKFWIQITVGAIIMAVLGYLSMTTFSMKGTLNSINNEVSSISPQVDMTAKDLSRIKWQLGSVEAKLNFTSERVNKITEALPLN